MTNQIHLRDRLSYFWDLLLSTDNIAAETIRYIRNLFGLCLGYHLSQQETKQIVVMATMVYPLSTVRYIKSSPYAPPAIELSNKLLVRSTRLRRRTAWSLNMQEQAQGVHIHQRCAAIGFEYEIMQREPVKQSMGISFSACHMSLYIMNLYKRTTLPYKVKL